MAITINDGIIRMTAHLDEVPGDFQVKAIIFTANTTATVGTLFRILRFGGGSEIMEVHVLTNHTNTVSFRSPKIFTAGMRAVMTNIGTGGTADFETAIVLA